jgi:hypothetical protein
MSKELSPLEQKIKEYLVEFTRKEPYITNTATRIAQLLPDDLYDLPKLLKKARQEGYSKGYAARFGTQQEDI